MMLENLADLQSKADAKGKSASQAEPSGIENTADSSVPNSNNGSDAGQDHHTIPYSEHSQEIEEDSEVLMRRDDDFQTSFCNLSCASPRPESSPESSYGTP